MIWEVLNFGIIIYTLFGFICLLTSWVFIHNKRIDSTLKYNIKSENSIYIIIPLLREQRRIQYLFKTFNPILYKYQNIKLVLVTTEREYLENRTNELSTPEVIKEMTNESKYRGRIYHFHYPKFNKVVAEQLNFAVESLYEEIPMPDQQKTFLIFYNADSKIDISFFDYICDKLSINTVLQQSSLFTSNIEKIIKKKRYLTACFGIYQSIWTIKHEIPRLLLGSNYYRVLPDKVSYTLLNYCVTHGLVIPMPVFNKIKGFPITKQGGEDIAIGYVLRAHGYTIEPVPLLENSDTPETFSSIYMQLAHWYVAILGYVNFHNILWKTPVVCKRRKLVLLSLQGIYDIISWLLKGWIVLIYLLLGIIYGKFYFSLFFLMLNFSVSLITLFIVYRKLPSNIFYKIKYIDSLFIMLLYPITVILRSFPAILGLVWFVRINAGVTFIRKKTE